MPHPLLEQVAAFLESQNDSITYVSDKKLKWEHINEATCSYSSGAAEIVGEKILFYVWDMEEDDNPPYEFDTYQDFKQSLLAMDGMQDEDMYAIEFDEDDEDFEDFSDE